MPITLSRSRIVVFLSVFVLSLLLLAGPAVSPVGAGAGQGSEAAAADIEEGAGGAGIGGTHAQADPDGQAVAHDEGADVEAAQIIQERTNRLLVVGGEAFVEGLLSFVVAVLWVLLVALQLARPYILQLIDKFSLRLGADLWWLAYVLIRDLVFVVTFVLSFFFYYPMLLTERAFPITGSLAATILFAVLVIKLVREVDDDPAAFALVTNLTVAGSGLYLAAVILGVEASRIEPLAPISRLLVTNTNPSLAFSLLWLSYLGLFGLGAYAVFYVLRSARDQPARRLVRSAR